MTAPSATVLHVPAGMGIDQETRAEHVQPGAANLYAENVRITHQGLLEKRYGFTALSSARVGTGSRTAGLRAAAYRESIVVSDGDQVDVYSPAMSQWSQRGRLPACDAKLSRVSSAGMPAGNEFLVDVAYSSSASVYAVVTMEVLVPGSGSMTFFPTVRLIDKSTNQLIRSLRLVDVGLTSGASVYAVAVGTDLVVTYFDPAAVTIWGRRMSLSAIESGFAAAVALAVNPKNSPSMALHALSDRVVLGYENDSAATARLTVKTFDSSVDALTTYATVTETTESAAVSAIALAGIEQLWTAWAAVSTNPVNVSVRTTALVSVASSSVFATGSVGPQLVAMGRVSSTAVYLTGSREDTGGGWRFGFSERLTVSGGVISADRSISYIGGWVPLSAPFLVGTRVYAEFSYDDTDGDIRNVVLADITADASTSGIDRNETARPVAWVAPRSNLAIPLAAGGTRHIVQESTNVWTSVHVLRASAVTTSLALTRYDFAATLKHLPLVYADNVYFTGGLLYQFDGERVYEAGFIVPPRLSLSSSGTGITGTFIYTAIHEYTDAVGNVIWSSPAPVQTITVTDDTVTILVRRPSMTAKEGYDGNTDMEPQGLRRTKTKIFRTLSTGTGDFYLLTTIQTSPLSGQITVTDAASDATISGNAKLYKAPGILGTAKDRQGVGACRDLVECNGVLVCIAEDGVTLRAFAEHVVGESPWTHDTLQLPIEGDGQLVALASLDGSVIAFKRAGIYIVPIEPTNDNMSVGGFGAPRRIAVDAGCIDPRSVVVTGRGVFFQSDRGIELLTRSLSVEPVGAKIQDTFALYPNVTAAVLDVRNGLVRFSLAQTGSSTVGVDAVYDLTINAWVSFDAKTGAAANAQSVSAAYVYYSGAYRYMWLDSVGTVRYEDFTTWLDAGTWVPAKWETAWLKTELQREHQTWQGILLADRESACGLVAEVAYDWADYSGANDKTWLEAAITTYTRQVELRLTGRYQAIKCRFHDTAPSSLGTGQGLSFVGLSLDIAPHQGPTQGTPKLAVASRR